MLETATSVEIKEITEILLTTRSICRNVSRPELPQNYGTIFNHSRFSGYQFPSNLNSPREAFLSPKLTERPPRPNAIKTAHETRSNHPSPLEGVVEYIMHNKRRDQYQSDLNREPNDKLNPLYTLECYI